MARKRNDLAAAKRRKQKTFAIVGAVVLALLLFIQVPRTMKMLDSGAEEAAPPPPPAQTEQPAAGSSGSAGAGAQTPSPAPAATATAELVDSDVEPEPDEGDLATFERFSSKDPFVQQIEATPEVAGGAPAPAPASTEAPLPAASTTETATGGPSTVDAPVVSTTSTPTSNQGAGPSDGEPAKRASAEISVNGKAEVVTVGRAFPKAEPTFRLVAAEGDSVKIGIASGGKFTSGAKAMTLRKGKPLTLVNTEDGSRYELILLAVR